MRRGLWLVVAVVLLGGLVACSGDDDSSSGPSTSSPAGKPGPPAANVPRGVVKTYTGLSRNHVNHRVHYPQTPPVGGDHLPPPGWQDCGFYDRPIYSEAGVHSLEHGAVWITYRPDLPPAQIALIKQYAQQPYVLASPWADGQLPAPVVLSAWGAQLQLDSLPSFAADQFLTKYRQSINAPEPGAPCDGGLSTPAR
jgi:hypothetical protein